MRINPSAWVWKPLYKVKTKEWKAKSDEWDTKNKLMTSQQVQAKIWEDAIEEPKPLHDVLHYFKDYEVDGVVVVMLRATREANEYISPGANIHKGPTQTRN